MNSRRTYKPILSFFLFAFFVLAALSCNEKQKESIDHPEYFDKVFIKAEEINNINPDKAVRYVDSVYAAFPDAGIKDLYRKYEYKANFYVEDINYYVGDVNRHHLVMLNIDSMFWVMGPHAQEKEFTKEYGNALLRRGNALMLVKDYPDAFEYYYKARQVIEQTNDTCLLSSYSLILGAVCYKQEKYLEAARYNKDAIKEILSCPADYRRFKSIQGRLDDIGLAYIKGNMPDSALWYFKEAINYLESQKDSFKNIPTHALFVEMAKGVVYGNMGDAYLMIGDTVTAEKCYKLDRNISGERGFDKGDGRCTQLKIASLYIAQKKLPEAAKTLLALRSSLDSSYWVDDDLKWLRLQMQYLDITGQPAKALPYIKTYLRIRDSLAALKPAPQVDLVKGYEQVKDRYEVALLESENERKNYYLLIVLTSSVLAMVMVGIFWYYWKRSRNLNKEIVKRNNEMRFALTSLTESEQRNTRLMQIVAHDLKNPVASIISITSIILDNNNVDDDDREMLELMKTSGERSIEMITNILNINNDADTLVKEPAEMHDLLSYCIDLLQFRAAEKNQHIKLETENITLSVNKEKIWRVISSLLVNAIKFSPEGAQINVRGRKEQDKFVVTVQDAGIGIPEELRGKIFEMFTDAKRPGTAGEQSFGLGLAISRKIIEAHGGKIWFESEAEKGTKFFISLPL